MDPEVAEFGRLLNLRKGGGSYRRIQILSVHEPPAVIQNIRLARTLERTSSYIDKEERIRMRDLEQIERDLRASLRKIKNKERDIYVDRMEARNQDSNLLLSRRETFHLQTTMRKNRDDLHLPDVNKSRYLVTGGFSTDDDADKKMALQRQRSVTLAQMEDISNKVVTMETDLQSDRKRRTGSVLYNRTTYA